MLAILPMLAPWWGLRAVRVAPRLPWPALRSVPAGGRRDGGFTHRPVHKSGPPPPCRLHRRQLHPPHLLEPLTGPRRPDSVVDVDGRPTSDMLGPIHKTHLLAVELD